MVVISICRRWEVKTNKTEQKNIEFKVAPLQEAFVLVGVAIGTLAIVE